MNLPPSLRIAIVALATAGVALVTATGATSAAAATTAVVEIRSGSCASTIYCYVPESLTVTVGDTVRWTDVSGSPHTVTRCTPAACDGHDGGTGTDASFTRADIDTGHDFTHVFSAPGTYNYYCEIHGYIDMRGTIVVRAAVTTTTSGVSPTTTTNSSAPTTSTVTTPNGGSTGSPGSTGSAAPAPAAARGSGRTAAASGARLASTGASTLVVVAIGCVFIAVGLLFASPRRRRQHP
jgi:plastocyanin